MSNERSADPRDALQSLDRNLWVATQPLRFAGLEIGTRMTVVRLPSGGLWLHSPIRPTGELAARVAELGPVEALVAPNRFHHLFAGEWLAPHEQARLYAAPGLREKRPELRIDEVIEDAPPAAWAGTLESVALGGIPFTNEVVFHHIPSRTLIASDLAFHIGPESPPLTRLGFCIAGCYGRLGPTVLERLLVRDRAAFRRALSRILAWPFERVIVAHGTVCEQDGRAALRESYRWVLEG